jgi:hypothetical protein
MRGAITSERVLTPEFLAEVAARIIEIRGHLPIVSTLTAEYGVTHAAVDNWIRKAKRLGLLPPTKIRTTRIGPMIPDAEPDEVVVDRLARGIECPIPWGEKWVYVAPLLQRGVPGNQVMRRLRISGTTYSLALRRSGLISDV